MLQKSSSILLVTKITLPPLRSKFVSRKSLFNRLNNGLENGVKLLLITAPAGYGKTMLVRSWLEELDVPSGWLSIDNNDNSPIIFWSYFIAAIQNVYSVGETAWAMLHSSQVPSIEIILTSLINDLVKIDFPLMLTIDDYHIIHNKAIDNGISFLLDHLPAKMQMIIVSREKPSLPLARLRARSQLVELQVRDLLFTYDETDTFINQVMELNLSRDKVEYLGEHTSGWIAGLQMAALSMQGLNPNDTSEFINGMKYSEGYIMEYLLEEVYNSQSIEIQNFLIRTSILDKLNDDLCRSVACIDEKKLPELGIQTMLEYLSSQKLFTVPSSNDGKWYRYHDLLSDFLSCYLIKTQPELIPVIHQRAAEWFENHGFYYDAIKHFLEAGNDLKAVALVEEQTLSMIMKGEVAIAENWIDMLPEKYLRLYPSLYMNKAWIMYKTGRLRELDSLFIQLRKTLESSTTISEDVIAGMNGEITAIQAAILDINGNNTEAIHLLKRTIESLPVDQVISRCICKLFLSQSMARAEGYTDETAQIFTRSISLCKETGNLENFLLIITGVINELVKKYIWQGYLSKAKTIVDDAFALIRDEGLDKLPTVSYLYNSLGKVFLEHYDLEKAEDCLNQGLALDSSGVTDSSIECYLTLARVKQAGGRNKEVQEIFDRLSETMVENDNPEKIETVDADRAECQLGQGNTKDIEYWFNRIGLNPSGPNSSDESLTGRRRLLRNSGYVMLARYYYQTKQYDAELKLLKELLTYTELKGWVGQTIELLGLQALTYEAIGDSSIANQIIEKAFSLAKPEGYARAFLDKGYPMVHLLQKNLKSSKNSTYISDLLRLTPLQNQLVLVSDSKPATEFVKVNKANISVMDSPGFVSFNSPDYDFPSIEMLSDREIDILYLLAGRLSDKEIAEKLCLSINTVKSHNRSIYQKLGVAGRRQAVKKGFECHLLEK